MQKQVVIAIDGPAGAGKSTVARAVAARLGFLYINTGAMYRAVAWLARQQAVPLTDGERLASLAALAHIDLKGDRILVDGHDVTDEILKPQVSADASAVSMLPGVRQALVHQQRQMAATQSVVMEGRDIGTVVFPYATVKIYLDADASERAKRRVRELQRRSVPVSLPEVSADMLARDARDRSRAESPLLQAPDAVYVDSTGLTQEEVEEHVLRIIRERTANGKEAAR